MTKSKGRASLKGRGVDILLGGSSDAEPAAPRATMPPSNPYAEPAPNPYAEPAPPVEPAARVTASGMTDAPAGTALVETPVEGVAEAAAEFALGVEVASGQPSEPVTSTLPAEETVSVTVAHLPGVPETPAFDVPVLETPENETLVSGDSGPVSVALPVDPTLTKRPLMGGLIMSTPPIPSPETFEPPTEMTSTGLKVAGVSRTRPRASDEEILQRIGPDRMEALSRRIDELYTQVAAGAITEASQASETLLYLRQARDKALEDRRQYDEAEYLVNVAQFMVTRASNLQRWTVSYAVGIMLYGLVALAVLAAGLVLDRLGILANLIRPALPADLAGLKNLAEVFTPYNTILWGGIGGVLGLMYSLLKHAAIQQDFDRQYVIWYYGQPFLGLLMGAIVHLFIVAGLFGLLNATSQEAQNIGQTLAALIAVAAAFRQNYIYAWLEWLLKALRPGGREADMEAASSSAAQPESSSGAAGVG